jgi:glycosyltransferase involved in cell wall biosynthesis
MKILYHHRIGSKDGQAVHIEEIIKALTEIGHQVVVVAPRSTQAVQFGAEAGVVASLKKFLPATFYEMLEILYGVFAFCRLWQAYRRVRPDVIYERYNLFLFAGAWLKHLTGIPLLLEVNAPLVHERKRFGGLANERLAQRVEEFTWRAADYVLPVTSVLAKFVRGTGVDPRRIVVIQNGVGSEFLSTVIDGSTVRRQLGIEGRLVLGFTGFIREWHGLDKMIDLIAESDPALNLHLLLVGDGPAVPELKRLASVRNVADRVTFAGLVARTEIISYVAAFDVAMQPRVVEYASPLKLFEYMALARAIVAPATANICEVLVNDETALLFPPTDTTGMRHSVERLCRDPELRAQLGKRAQDAITEKGLTWKDNAWRISELFRNLLPPQPAGNTNPGRVVTRTRD